MLMLFGLLISVLAFLGVSCLTYLEYVLGSMLWYCFCFISRLYSLYCYATKVGGRRRLIYLCKALDLLFFLLREVAIYLIITEGSSSGSVSTFTSLEGNAR